LLRPEEREFSPLPKEGSMLRQRPPQHRNSDLAYLRAGKPFTAQHREAFQL